MEQNNSPWVLREEGKNLEAIALWMKSIYELEEQGNWEDVVNTLVDVQIAWKNLGKEAKNSSFFDIASTTLDHIDWITQTHNISPRKDILFYRGDLLMELNKYKEAQASLEEYLNASELVPEKQAEVKAKIGFCKAKSGVKDEGITLIRESISTLEQLSGKTIHEGKDLALIYKLGAVLYLVQVIEDKSEAASLLKNALVEARKYKLGAREKQIINLMSEMGLS